MVDIKDVKYARIAEAAHEVCRAYFEASDDMTHKAWWDLPQTIRVGTAVEVRRILTGVTKSPRESTPHAAVFRAAVVESARLLGMEIQA